MSNPAPELVQKLWNYCSILRDDGLSFRLRRGFQLRSTEWNSDGQAGGQDGDYVEQLTFLLLGSLAPARSGLRPFAVQKPFRSPPGGSSLKMADEQSRPPFNPPSPGYGGTGKPSAVPKEFAWPSLLARAGRPPLLNAFTGELA